MNTHRGPRMFGKDKHDITYKCQGLVCHRNPLDVIIHSSSHLGSHRGVANGVKARLGRGFNVEIDAKPGRKWDLNLIHKYHFVNNNRDGLYQLHVILLGDNDVRNTDLSDRVNPFIAKFGESINKHKTEGSYINIFVNGLLPFPMYEFHNYHELVQNYHRYTQAMSRLIYQSNDLYFIPMRDSIMKFCEDRKINVSRLFRNDKVHLTKVGEQFLIEHLVRQIRMYAASIGNCVRPTDLTFFQGVVSSHKSKDENLKILLREYRVDSTLT